MQQTPYTNTVIGWINNTSTNYSLRTNYNMTRYGLDPTNNGKPVICYDSVNKALVCTCLGKDTFADAQGPLSQTSNSLTQTFTAIGCPTALSLGTPGNATFYCVIKGIPGSVGSYGGCFSFTNNTDKHNAYGFFGKNEMYINTLSSNRYDAVSIDSACPVSNIHIYRVVNNAGSCTYNYITSIKTNSVITSINRRATYSYTGSNSIGGSVSPIMIGAGGSSTTNVNYNGFSGGSIYQILLFTRVLNSTEMDTIETDLCTKWNC
jgi:hypothetical protein